MSVSEISTNSGESFLDEDLIRESISLASTSQPAEALKLLYQVLDHQPNHIPALHAKAIVLLLAEKNQEALQTCSKIQSLVNPSLYSNEKYGIPRGLVHTIEAGTLVCFETDKSEQAMNAIETAIKINKIAPFILVRSMIQVRKANFNEALKDANFVLENPYQHKLMGLPPGELEEIAMDIRETVLGILQHPNLAP